jgi:hypothetical protein
VDVHWTPRSRSVPPNSSPPDSGRSMRCTLPLPSDPRPAGS